MDTTDYFNNLTTIRRNITVASIWEQLAEECSELAHASLKMSRKLRNENPTPLSYDEIENSVMEEYTDVLVCASILQIRGSVDKMDSKIQRWADRIKDSKE